MHISCREICDSGQNLDLRLDQIFIMVLHQSYYCESILKLKFCLTLDQFDCIYVSKKCSGLTVDFRKYFEFT